MFQRLSFLLLLCLSMTHVIFAQIDSVQDAPPTPRFRDFQFDYVTLISTSTTSFSFDYDIMPLTIAQEPIFFGLRAGFDYIQSSGTSGSTNGSPFSDYNLLARLTAKIQHSRVDIYSGYSYRSSTTDGLSGSQFKIGLEFKYLFAHDKFGLIVKLCAVGGSPSPIGCAGLGAVCNLDF